MIEQLERDSSDPARPLRRQTVVISEGVDAATPVMIEVVVDKDGPVSLELLTKLLIVGAVFLATRHIAPSVAIVGAILSAFIPDVVTSVVRRRRWGKKRVGLLAALFTFFAALDSAFARAMGRRGRRAPHPGSGALRPRRGLGLGHAVTTTAVAATVCAVAVAVPAIASGGSPFQAAHADTRLAATRAHTQPAVARTHTRVPSVTQTSPPSQANSGASNGPSAPGSHDRYIRVGVSPIGVPGSVTLAPGQRAHLEFTLPQSNKVIFAIGTGSTLSAYSVWHDGDQADGSSSIDLDSTHPYIPAGNLAAGQHTITVASTATRGGTLRYVLYGSSDRTQTIGVSATGVPGSVTVTPGQRAHLEFTLAQSSRVVFAVGSGSTLTAYSIWHDNDQADGSSSIDIDSTHPFVPADLSAGAHTITIEPSGTAAGTLRYVVYGSADLTRGTDVSARGVQGKLMVMPGQRAHLAFTLTQAERVVLSVSPDSTLTDYSIWRDDGQDSGSSIDIDATHPYAPPEPLSARSHTITIEPAGAASGTLLYTLYASADATQTVGFSPQGTDGSATVSPGQQVHLAFTLTQPSRVTLAVSSNSSLTDYNIWRDDGQDGGSSIDIDSARPYAPPGLLAAGPHTITIQSAGVTGGTVLYTLTARPG